MENKVVKTWAFKCPKCGSGERIAHCIMEDERKEGRMSENVKYAVFDRTEVTVVDSTRQPKVGDAFAIMRRYEDNCARCGTGYFFKIEYLVVHVTAKLDNLASKIVMPNMPTPPFKIGQDNGY